MLSNTKKAIEVLNAYDTNFEGYTGEEIAEAVNIATAALSARWISVRKKPPKEGEDVIFCDIDGDIKIGHRVEDRFYENGSWDRIKDVTAWMPLPEAYND